MAHMRKLIREVEKAQGKPNIRVRRARASSTSSFMMRLKQRYSIRSGVARVYPKMVMFPTFSKLYNKLKGFTQPGRFGKR